jgi:hypothetical protein
VLGRVLGHLETSYFVSQALDKWRILHNNRCWVCERWKQFVFFYDRKKNIYNQSLDLLGRIFMILVNKKLGTWDLRRVAPNLKVNGQYWGETKENEMSPLM